MVSVEVIQRSGRLDPRSVGDGWQRFSSTIRGEGTAARRAWQPGYVRRTVCLDVLCAAAAAFVAHAVFFGSHVVSTPGPPFWMMCALPVVWALAMVVARTYEQRFLWVGV